VPRVFLFYGRLCGAGSPDRQPHYSLMAARRVRRDRRADRTEMKRRDAPGGQMDALVFRETRQEKKGGEARHG